MDILSLSPDRFIDGDLPLYGDIKLLTAERHGDLFLTSEPSFAFASNAVVVPLTIDEFERAALDYPIVFFGPARRAFAVMGITPDKNAFIDTAIGFRTGAYVPAYLRRHPFALVKDREQDTWVLGVDETSDRLARSDACGAQSLFAEGIPTAALSDIVAFCESYENAQQRTDRLVGLLDDLELFEARQAHHQLPDAAGHPGEPVLLIDYVAINRGRLEALDEQARDLLRAAGGWGPSYAHLFSAANWERLAQMG